MPKMTWKKSPESLLRRFAAVVPKDPSVEHRSMFGYPCAFLNGHMFCGLFQDLLIVRLPEGVRAQFLKLSGARVFEPMPGRPMKEYVVVPPAVLESDPVLEPWLRLSREYVAGLPPRAKKAKKAKKAAKKARAPAKRPRPVRRGSS